MTEQEIIALILDIEKDDADVQNRYEKSELIEAIKILYGIAPMTPTEKKPYDFRYTANEKQMEEQLSENKWERQWEGLREAYGELEERYREALKDYEALREQMQELQQKNGALKKALDEKIKHQGGSRTKYSESQRKAIVEYYNNGGTYRSTAKHFGISTNTVGRILHEAEE